MSQIGTVERPVGEKLQNVLPTRTRTSPSGSNFGDFQSVIKLVRICISRRGKQHPVIQGEVFPKMYNLSS